MHSYSVRLFLLGFLTLFLELALIRYLSGNIWNMGYFPNLVLLGAFLGMGLGFVFHRMIPEERSSWYFHLTSFALLFLIVFIYYYHPVVPGFNRVVGKVGEEVFFTSTPATTRSLDYLVFIWIFINIILIFFLVSQHTAKFFTRFAPLHAYTLDILGSCCGILAFMLISLFQVPAFGWVISMIALFALISTEGFRRILGSALILMAALLVWLQDAKLLSRPDYDGPFYVRWSPYQKVEAAGFPGETIEVFVNGIDHQVMYDRDSLSGSFYVLPHQYRLKRGLPPYEDVLVIGAGSGNDVATALGYDATRVDAVEIDPVIAQFGRFFHPLQPYRDTKVQLTIDDGRAFMTQTQRHYDLIIFALTDSLVKVSPMAQLRLENYLFTKESVQRAFDLLKPDGDLIFYNFYRYNWVRDKIRMMAYRATGKFPRTIYQTRTFSMFVLNQNTAGEAPAGINTSLAIPTDDWPFLYLQSRSIPSVYRNAMLGLIGLILVLAAILGTREASETSTARWDLRTVAVRGAFLLMGVAFLLLETKSVIQFSLLFGTTWINNSLVFLAVLVFVLLANWTVQLLARRGRSLSAFLNLAFLLLVFFCLLAVLYPLANLLQVQNVTLRFVAASVLTFSPVYFANLIFSLSFRERPLAENLFGWNLIGAAFGGVLEYSSMGLGYNALGIVVAICYTMVFVLLLFERWQKPVLSV